jgi:hypothetical protein
MPSRHLLANAYESPNQLPRRKSVRMRSSQRTISLSRVVRGSLDRSPNFSHSGQGKFAVYANRPNFVITKIGDKS